MRESTSPGRRSCCSEIASFGKDARMTNDDDLVRDNAADHRFELAVDEHLAFSVYEIDGPVITFVHTVVPEPLEGQGIGSRLISGALDQVRARGLKVRPQCSFVRRFIERHAKYQHLLA